MKSGTDERDDRIELTPVDFDPFAESAAESVLPLTEAQQEMWTACAMGADASCSYNQCYPLRLVGPLSIDAMTAALRRVVARHAALRAVFAADGERQVVREALEVSVSLEDLSGLAPADREAEIARRLDRETREAFDLERGPLLRARLIREGGDRHLLLLTAHHIVCDGWSSSIVLRDLTLCYGAELHGLAASLPEPASYSGYVREHAAGSGAPEARADEDWWAARFADGAPALELPLDRPRPSFKTYAGRQIEERLDAELCGDLKRIGARHGATLFATLLAACEVWLHRLSSQTDFVVGIAVAGQASVPSGDLVGHCVNTLPLRVAVDPDASFSDHLRAARSALLEAQEHSELTFGGLVRRLPLVRDASRTPLVSVTFNVDRVGARAEFSGLSTDLTSSPKSFVNFEMILNLVDDGRDVVVECGFNTDLYDEATIRRWLGQFRTLLVSIAADPSRASGGLPVLTESETRDVLEAEGAPADDPERPVHEQFEAQADRTPDAPAVACPRPDGGWEELSYRELDARANRLAHHLAGKGATAGTLVGLCLDRSADMVVAILAILKTGAAYVPLDPSFPVDRLAAMVDDSGLALVVATGDLAGRVARSPAGLVLLDAGRAAIASSPPHRPAAAARLDDRMYVIYTSGSTGRPKGTEIEHRSVSNFLASMRREPGFRPGESLLAVTTPSFDISVLELMLPLVAGGKVIVAPREAVTDGDRLLAMMREVRPSVMQATPATWRMLLLSGWEGTPGLKILCGGEALPRDLADELLSRGREVWNLYGPTETTIWSTVARVEPGTGAVPIGRPIARTRAYVLDGRMQPVPAGVLGELYIGGAGLARGYLKRPELTMERFVPDPFRRGERLYRTGDVARRRHDGQIEYVGRNDDQVKIRGFRIELGEVEAAIGRHPALREAAVAANDDGQGGRRLVAYLVSGGERAKVQDEVRDLLRTQLPDYMVPSAFVFLDALPLTANRKVDRKALPAPVVVRSAPAVTPRSETERVVAATWGEVLGVPGISVHDDFFTLGGHSLQAAQIMARLRAAFPLELPLRLLFQSPTVEGLATAIDALAWAARGAMAPAPGARREEFEL
jgi:amino acid adenylation domain-containing protein